MSLKLSLLWILAGLALHFAFAFSMGAGWERGRAAKRENAMLSRQLDGTRAAAKDLHALAVSIQAEQLAGIERLNAIARDFEDSREQQQTHFTRQRTALAALLATRPDLGTSAGADVLRHWRASNAGAGYALADPAPAADPGQSDAAVSTAADAGGGHLGGIIGEPRCSDGALSPVPDDARPLDRVGGRVGTGGAADMVCGDETGRTDGGGVR